MNAPKNISASVKARLQNVAATRGEDFNLLLLRYGIERLLFRLSQSPHADRFLLKGAMLFVVWDEKTHRPTRDLDLLGLGSTEKANLIRVFAAVAAVPVIDDGIVFDPKSVQASDIREDNAYGGVRIRLLGKLGTAEVPVQIDVGGDWATSAALVLDAMTAGDVVLLQPDTIEQAIPWLAARYGGRLKEAALDTIAGGPANVETPRMIPTSDEAVPAASRPANRPT